jgi:hypothetical protein
MAKSTMRGKKGDKVLKAPKTLLELNFEPLGVCLEDFHTSTHQLLTTMIYS